MAKSLQEHLTATEGLARLAAHAERLMAFDRSLKTVLPATLASHARVANFKLGKLFIHTDNSAVAAKVRQLGPRIALALSASTVKVAEVGVSVHPLSVALTSLAHQRPSMPGNKQTEGLALLAQSLPENSALKRAVERLLHTVNK
ncbi:MAG: DciA family protein [Rugosibacter sp.]|nr:DciA family protein [Rugosibacter sp.]